MFDHPYFKKTGTFRYNGIVPEQPTSPFRKSKNVTNEKSGPSHLVKYQCTGCRYTFSRKSDYRGSISKCPYCGRQGTVQAARTADDLLQDLTQPSRFGRD